MNNNKENNNGMDRADSLDLGSDIRRPAETSPTSLGVETRHRQMKNRLNSKLEYYYGFGMGRYGEVLDELRIHGAVNSCRTSSIPLAEFWQPDNLERISEKLRPFLKGFNAERALKFFEFPTDPVADGKCLGRASMTDLKLMDGDWQIAIEAKYTEYSRMPNETVSEWFHKNADAGFFLRRRVGRVWLDYIREAKCTDIRTGQALYTEIGDVCYQFLHRTASACYKTNGADGHKPVLIYQLFFNANDPTSREDRLVFERELRKWARLLKLRNMKFLIMSVPIINADEVVSRYAGSHAEIFKEMEMNTIYKFDFDGIRIEDVDLTKEVS